MKAVAVLFFVLLGLAMNSPAKGLPFKFKFPCPLFCPQVYVPVCGFDGHLYKTFPNDCEMASQNCWTFASFKQVRSGECAELKEEQEKNQCPVCPEIWSPVCGQDGNEVRTFASDCFLRAANCLEKRSFIQTKSGVCEQDMTDKVLPLTKIPCPACTKIYDPVCATDGNQVRSFPSACSVRAHNCFKSTEFYVTRSGEC